MMNSGFSIAREEWRLWLRSRLALSALLVFALLLTATSVLTALRNERRHQQRSEQQALAEEAFCPSPIATPTEWWITGTMSVEFLRPWPWWTPVSTP